MIFCSARSTPWNVHEMRENLQYNFLKKIYENGNTSKNIYRPVLREKTNKKNEENITDIYRRLENTRCF